MVHDLYINTTSWKIKVRWHWMELNRIPVQKRKRCTSVLVHNKMCWCIDRGIIQHECQPFPFNDFYRTSLSFSGYAEGNDQVWNEHCSLELLTWHTWGGSLLSPLCKWVRSGSANYVGWFNEALFAFSCLVLLRFVSHTVKVFFWYFWEDKQIGLAADRVHTTKV